MKCLNSALSALFLLILEGNFESAIGNNQNWEGKWFPNAPGTNDSNPSFQLKEHKELYDPAHGIVMGVENADCDDGRSRLRTDWDFSPLNYSCYEPKSFYRPRSFLQPIYSEDHIPYGYSAPHRCMDESIEYPVTIPTFGVHRPLWAKYGEYTFLPRQRWVHNLEHGAIVMLYHPCADKNEVHALRNLVKKCLYRHIITPFNLLSPERPLALVAWGRRLEISKLDPEIVLDFIRQSALNGPEQTARDGQYDLLLKEHAEIVSDLKDGQICKKHMYNFIQ